MLLMFLLLLLLLMMMMITNIKNKIIPTFLSQIAIWPLLYDPFFKNKKFQVVYPEWEVSVSRWNKLQGNK